MVRAYLYWGADLAPGVNNGADAAAPGGADPDDEHGMEDGGRCAIGGAGAYTAVDATAPGRDGVWAGHRRAGTRSRATGRGTPTRCAPT